jgi:hypothetical protein
MDDLKRKPRRASIYSQPQSWRTQRDEADAAAASVDPDAFPEGFLVSEPQRYPDAALIPFNVGLVSQLVLTRTDTARVLLVIQNISAAPVWVNFGSNAGINNGLLLDAGVPATPAAGGAIFFDAAVPQGEVFAISNAANSTIIVLYANKRFM